MPRRRLKKLAKSKHQQFPQQALQRASCSRRRRARNIEINDRPARRRRIDHELEHPVTHDKNVETHLVFRTDGTAGSMDGQDKSGYNFHIVDDFPLNKFLLELAENITEEELTKLKFLIGGSEKATLARISNPMDFFLHLREKSLLSIDNICNLQALIWHIGRKDLYNKMVKFARLQQERPLHFYTPRETPEKGNKYVFFHVQGKVDRDHVNRIHSDIADVLCVPKRFVVIAGIERSNSVILTLMVPKKCGMTLTSLTDKEKSTLEDLSIDYFIMDGTKYTVAADEDLMIPIDDETLRSILQEISKGLKKEETKILLKSIEMDENEAQRYKHDQNTLLEIIMMKTRKQLVPFNEVKFIHDYLQKVKRLDLMVILNRIVQEKRAINQPSTRVKGGQDPFIKANKQPKREKPDDFMTKLSPDYNSRFQKSEVILNSLQILTSKNQTKMPYLNDKKGINLSVIVSH